eukprot:2991635-Prorocentrum_lima.AAC.1
MLNLRAHVQTYTKWFCKKAMAWGQRPPTTPAKTLLSEVSGRAREDLIQETETSRAEYLAMCDLER